VVPGANSWTEGRPGGGRPFFTWKRRRIWVEKPIKHTLGIIIPTDELIFLRGVGIPPTRSNMNLNGDTGWWFGT